MVDLPDPEGPIIAVEVPVFIENLTSESTFLISSGLFGYLKETLLKKISFCNSFY